MAGRPNGYRMRIFANPGLEAWFAGNIKAVLENISSEPATRILQENREVFLNSVIKDYVIQVPEINFEDVSVDDYDQEINIFDAANGIDLGGSRKEIEQIVVYQLPLIGNPKILLYKPTAGLPWELEVIIKANVLCFELPLREEAESVKNTANGIISNIREQLADLGNDIEAYNIRLRKEAAEAYDNRKKYLINKEAKLAELGLPKKKVGEVPKKVVIDLPESSVKRPDTEVPNSVPSERKPPREAERYDVALSFAGEDREYVKRVYEYLKGQNILVFYDRDKDIEVEMWGEDLVEYLDNVYRKCSGCCVIFISKYYAEKVWPALEKRSALARALKEKETYILPARFDDTDLSGLQPTVSYFNLKEYEPEEFARKIIEKLKKINR